MSKVMERYEKRMAKRRRMRGVMYQLELDLRPSEEWLEEDIGRKKWVINPDVRYSFEK